MPDHRYDNRFCQSETLPNATFRQLADTLRSSNDPQSVTLGWLPQIDMSVQLEEVDHLVSRLLMRAELDQPPFDALEIARRLRIDVIIDNDQAGRARHKLLRGRSTIFVKQDDRAERLQWSVAHELGEIFSFELKIDATETAIDSGIREQIASEIGTRLLLPEPVFSKAARASRLDLSELKEQFATASYELIARRLLTVGVPVVVSQFDNGHVVRRSSPNGKVSQRLSPLEQFSWQQAHTTSQPQQHSDESILTRTYAIHEANWKREFQITTPLE
jgi:hypothetical protein